MSLEIGKKLWLVYGDKRRGEPREVEVIKVGRKYATLSNHHGRIDIETLRIDAGEYASPGRCYLSKEEYEAMRELSYAWGMFKREIRDMYGDAPKGVTIENIKQARKLIGLNE